MGLRPTRARHENSDKDQAAISLHPEAYITAWIFRTGTPPISSLPALFTFMIIAGLASF
jgi:hypothetical protein